MKSQTPNYSCFTIHFSPKLLLTLFIIHCSLLSVAQQTNLDSLWNIWIDNTQPDSTRSIALHQYTWEGFLFNDPDSAYSLAKMEYDFAESKGLKAKMGDALNTLGVSFASRSDYVSALSNFHSSFDLFAEISNKMGMAHAANSLGNSYRNIGNASKAIKYYEQSLKFSDEINDVHSSARALANIGTIYSLQSEYAKARDYYLQALEGHNKLDESYSIGGLYSLMGSDYHKQKEYDKAFEYFEKAYASLKDANAKFDLTMLNANRASLFFDMKEYAKAHELLDETMSEMEAIGFQSGINSGKVEKGNFFLQQNQYKEAIEFCSQGFEAFHSHGFLQGQKEACECLYESYKAIGDGTNALIFLEKMNTITVSLDAEETSKKLQQMEFQKEMLADSIAKAEEARLVQETHQEEVRQKTQTRNMLLGGVVFLLILGLITLRAYKQKRDDNKVISEQKRQTEIQKEQIEETHKEITDSIAYAKRIQNAILPPMKLVRENLKQSFILYKPKDVVAGDFYWMETKGDIVLFAACDCTGHGVPGAMVSVVCNNGLNRSVRENGLTEPGEILTKTREIVLKEFEKSEEQVKDGMDAALCALQGNTLKYAGANNPLWIIRQGATEIEEIKGDKQPIGTCDNPAPFTTHTLSLQAGDSIYLFSDGFVDQFGGEKGKKLKSKAFKELLLSLQDKTMEEQCEIASAFFDHWKTGYEQIDDVCLIGVRI
jgi:serine phosphatase RsbU (regulator of sigma subunit)